jgi:adenylate cyclase class 2
VYEIELKIPADHEDVRERLRELGAEPLGTTRQVDTYYDHPGRSFAETDEALRLRREEAADGTSEARLTYKGPLVESTSKTREELETGVDDPDALAEMVRALEFEPVPTVRKEREQFALAGYTVALDSVAGVGSFVEAEREGTEAEIEEIREGARDLLRDLGLDPANHVRTSYLELVFEADADDPHRSPDADAAGRDFDGDTPNSDPDGE